MDDCLLRITLAQYDIAWEDKPKNMALVSQLAQDHKGQTDVIVLPEMSFTAFSINAELAEGENSALLADIKRISVLNDVAICGSLLYQDGDQYNNRAFFITPDKSYFYNKRHLFRMGLEGDVISAGQSKTIFNYKGFNISLFVCYDLRFPVWSRNTDNQYDLAIYVANWPQSRRNVWCTLLKARAMENMCYVCGVNRVGLDNDKLNHSGDSMLINQRGEELLHLPENDVIAQTFTISKAPLDKDRHKFPVWKDADSFIIN